MIVVKLMGGLGNQMFQYAAGRALSLRRRAPLYLDVSWFEQPRAGTTPRHYELGHLRCVEHFAGSWLRWKFARVEQRRSEGLLLRNHAYIRQSGRRFDEEAFGTQSKHVYLDGYWQCERYFEDARSTLLIDFALRAPPDPPNARMLASIGESNAVAVHVRRGDYVSNQSASALHGTCSVEYYKAAVTCVRERIGSPRFFIFSDEPDWVRHNLELADAEYASHNPPDAGHEDLRLMTRCKHFIVANSSFSWWAAWLGQNPEKLVIAPRRWFADPSAEEGDIVPRSWQRL